MSKIKITQTEDRRLRSLQKVIMQKSNQDSLPGIDAYSEDLENRLENIRIARKALKKEAHILQALLMTEEPDEPKLLPMTLLNELQRIINFHGNNPTWIPITPDTDERKYAELVSMTLDPENPCWAAVNDPDSLEGETLQKLYSVGDDTFVMVEDYRREGKLPITFYLLIEPKPTNNESH